MNRSRSWGQYPVLPQTSFPIWWRDDILPNEQFLLPYGSGLSYGDSCQIEHGTLIETRGLNRFIQFDKENGIITCEAGCTLQQILSLIEQHGWFLPVLPGTQFVTVGGAIANDIHGKNHFNQGSFGDHVLSLHLRRSDNDIIHCTQMQNEDWLQATIGGLGLTGLITQATIQLMPVKGSSMIQENHPFTNIEKCFEIFEKTSSAYKVAWLDLCSSSRHFGRGIVTCADHSDKNSIQKKFKFSIPCNFPNWFLSPTTIKYFNQNHYKKQLQASKEVHYTDFFFPLNHISHWNRIYGKRGFLQYQCSIPKAGCMEILEKIQSQKIPIFLTTLKYFGDKKMAGLLSFPEKAYTLAIDTPFQGEQTLQQLAMLDDIVTEHHGKIYPAKDARMPSELFRTMYPNWEKFTHFMDPAFNSSFWQRMTQEKI